MDIGLSGMNGIEAARHILSFYSPCLLLISGQPEESLPAEVREIGISGILTKPIQAKRLPRLLQEAFANFCQREGVQA